MVGEHMHVTPDLPNPIFARHKRFMVPAPRCFGHLMANKNAHTAPTGMIFALSVVICVFYSNFASSWR